MPTLLSLPNELLDQIIDDAHIDDIEAFSLCCKRVHRLAATRLEEHLARKFNYPAVAIEPESVPEEQYSYDDIGTDYSPTSLLRDFLKDEKNALYPRSMSIGGIDRHYRIPNGKEKFIRALLNTYFEQHDGLEDKIVAKVTQIQKYLYTEMPAVEAQDWIDRIKKGDLDATAALLITLFPNVKTLSVSNCPALAETLLVRTLERLTVSAAKLGPRAIGAFKELSEVNLKGSIDHYLYGDLIAVFMGLPSMRVIKGCRVHWLANDGPYGIIPSSLKEVSLECSQINSEPFVSCLKGIEKLERLTYDMVPRYEYTTIWEPRLIVKTLRKYARRTLVHLELTGEIRSVDSTPADGEPFIGTLRSFQVLESIRLMTMMLFKRTDGKDIDQSDDIIEETLEDLIRPTSLVEPRRLVDFLPPSAKKLELVGGISSEEARDMFADLPNLKRERVPKLGEIVLEDSDPLERETKDLCKYAGIRLKSIKRVVNGYQRIYAVTKPAPQVDGLAR